MKINSIRLIQVFLLFYLLMRGTPVLVFYWAVVFVLLEFLNRRREFLEQPGYRRLNLVFISFPVVIFLNRTRNEEFGPRWEWVINSLEHIFFALVICLVIYQFFLLKAFRISDFAKRLILVNVIFFGLGVLNELFQMAAQNDFSFYFSVDSRKDILMNVIGAIIFTIAYSWRKFIRKK